MSAQPRTLNLSLLTTVAYEPECHQLFQPRTKDFPMITCYGKPLTLNV